MSESVYQGDGCWGWLCPRWRGRWEVRYDLMMAAATVVTLPVLALFFFTQRTFIEGIALTGIKG